MDFLSYTLLMESAIFRFFDFLVPAALSESIAELPDFVGTVVFVVYIAFALLCVMCCFVMFVQLTAKRDGGCWAYVAVVLLLWPILITTLTALIGSVIVMVSIGGHPMAAELRWICSGIIVVVLAMSWFLLSR